MDKTLHPDAALIDALGGTTKVAELCDVKPPSVSEWKWRGIPKAQKNYLRLRCPEQVARFEIQREAA